jgi:hypothetical protein
MAAPESLENPPHRPRAPVLTALASQGAAFVVCFGLAMVLRRGGGPAIELPLILAAQGVVAAVIGMKWGLPGWWIPLHLVLPAAAGAALMLELRSWVFLAAFVALALVFWNATGERVPLYLSNRRTWAALSQVVGPDARQFIDIGCGIGGTLVHMARARPELGVTGIESAPLPFAAAWLRCTLSGAPNVSVRYGDFWNLDLADFDAVYAFLSPAPMPALYEKARAEMKPGSRLISNSFAVPGHEPDETVELDDRRRTRLLIWRL